MDHEQAFILAYNAALQGAIIHHGVVGNLADYEQMRKFCVKAARGAAQAFLEYSKEQNKNVS